MVKVSKTDARQGERRPGQERVMFWSILASVAILGGITLVVILTGFGN